MERKLVDLDAILSRVDPWEFYIKVDGLARPVRRLTLADLAELQRFGSMGKDEAARFLAGLFEEQHRPDVSQWDTERAAAVVATIVEFYADDIKKKFTGTREAIRRQLGGLAEDFIRAETGQPPRGGNGGT